MIDLEQEEARVLGCLIEKEATTPETYPLTLNSLRAACNQTSSRNPVVAYDDSTVQAALASLRERELIRIVHSVHNRATKYRHVLDEVLRLEPDELAVVAVLLLRGPQTVGELRTRTERMALFENLTDVQRRLDRLASRDEPLVVMLERQPGQKDVRYAHLLSGPPDPASVATSEARPPRTPTNDRIEELERRLAELEDRLQALEAALGD